MAVALAIPAVRHLRETPPPAPPETRVEIVTPATDEPTSFALSPDGRQIVFVASGDGASRLWLRSLATTTAQPLAGTEGATFPFWSPDGRSVGFFAGGALKRLDLGGGAPQTLAPAISGRGGTWNADGVIVFAPSATSPLMRVSATGGAAVAVTTLGPQQSGHRAPHFLPDGRRFLFYVRGAPDTAGIYLGALDGSAPTRLTPADSAGVYLPAGWLLWVRAGTLVAQRLDVAQAALTGEPVTLADGVAVDGSCRSAVSVAATGLVAYRTGAGSQRQLTWVDRSGTARGTVGDPDGTSRRSPRVPRRPSRGRGPHGAGQHGPLAAGRRPHEPRSRSMRRSTDFPSGRPTARGSCSARTGRVQVTSTRSSRAARAWRSGSWPPTRSRPPAAGRRTVASCCITASTRRRAPTSGSCRWWAIARRRCS